MKHATIPFTLIVLFAHSALHAQFEKGDLWLSGSIPIGQPLSINPAIGRFIKDDLVLAINAHASLQQSPTREGFNLGVATPFIEYFALVDEKWRAWYSIIPGISFLIFRRTQICSLKYAPNPTLD